MEMLKAENIGWDSLRIDLHMQPYYQERFGYKTQDYPNAAWLSESHPLSLPFFPQMTEGDVQDVARAVRKVIARAHRV